MRTFRIINMPRILIPLMILQIVNNNIKLRIIIRKSGANFQPGLLESIHLHSTSNIISHRSKMLSLYNHRKSNHNHKFPNRLTFEYSLQAWCPTGSAIVANKTRLAFDEKILGSYGSYKERVWIYNAYKFFTWVTVAVEIGILLSGVALV